MFVLQANERVQELENGGGNKLGKIFIKIIIVVISFCFLFKVELQKALTLAEEQIETAKVQILFLIKRVFDYIYIYRKNVMIFHIH